MRAIGKLPAGQERPRSKSMLGDHGAGAARDSHDDDIGDDDGVRGDKPSADRAQRNKATLCILDARLSKLLEEKQLDQEEQEEQEKGVEEDAGRALPSRRRGDKHADRGVARRAGEHDLPPALVDAGAESAAVRPGSAVRWTAEQAHILNSPYWL